MIDGFRTRLMLFLGREYVTRGWVMQLHYGALRNVNRRGWRVSAPTQAMIRLAMPAAERRWLGC